MRKLALVLLLLAGACTGGDGESDPSLVTLHIYNLKLRFGETGDPTFKVAVHSSSKSLDVTLRGGLPSPNKHVVLCAVRADLNLPGPAPDTCEYPEKDRTMEVAYGGDLAGISLVKAGRDLEKSGKPKPDPGVTIEEVEITYRATDRNIDMRLPKLETGGLADRPTFELTPSRAGNLAVTASWPGEGRVRLALEKAGKVAKDGASPLELKATLRNEGKLGVRNAGPAQTLDDVRVHVEWP